MSLLCIALSITEYESMRFTFEMRERQATELFSNSTVFGIIVYLSIDCSCHK
jgi:hypothetical protein